MLEYSYVILPANAASKVLERDPLLINRTEGYIGVLVDDLTTQGTNEPYRMFTSRSEFRLTLRPDNADIRLTEKGFKIGLVSNERYEKMVSMRDNLNKAIELLKDYKMPSGKWREKLEMKTTKSSVMKSAFGFLAPSTDSPSVEQVCELDPAVLGWIKDDVELCKRIKIESLYAFVVKEQAKEVEEVRRDESLLIPTEIDYLSKSLNLSFEERDKLISIQPQTVSFNQIELENLK